MTATATPTSRAAAISELWDDDDRLVGATQDLFKGIGNAASELVGHLFAAGAYSVADNRWVAATTENVELAGVDAARRAMIETLSELLDATPNSMRTNPGSAILRELLALRASAP